MRKLQLKWKRIGAIGTALALAVSTLTGIGVGVASQGAGTTAKAVGGIAVYYQKWNETSKKVETVEEGCADYTTLTENSLNWGDNKKTDVWYVLDGDTTISNRVTVEGTVNLILCDNKTLNAESGISVSGQNKLNIYAQSDSGSKGALEAVGSYECAGIGGDWSKDGGIVTIHGGKITATGGSFAAGIGGGFARNGGTVTIYGGRVTTTGGLGENSNFCNGIGAGIEGQDNGILTLAKGMKLYGADTQNPELDEENYIAVENDDYARKRYMTVLPHTHEFTYEVGEGDDANKIMAACGKTGCGITDGLTMTLSAPTDLIYNGKVKEATLNADYDKTAFPDDYIIKYYQGTKELNAGDVKNAGTYTAKVTVGTGDKAVTASVDFTIAKAALTVKADAKTITYGDKDVALTYQVSGLVDGDTADKALTGTLVREAGTDVGTYKITQGTLAAENYDITFTGADYTIQKAAESKEETKTEDSKQEDSKTEPATQETKAELDLNAGLKISQTGSKIKIQWGKVAAADGYEIYVQYCGKKFGKAAKKIGKNSITQISITKLNGKKISLKKNFKVYIAAYKKVGGKKVRLAKSIEGHVVGRKNTRFSNAKSIKLITKSLSVAVGKTTKIKAKTVLVSSKKKQLSNAHAKEFRYASTDKTIATVNKNGKIQGVKAGTCTVYVYARNGYAKKVTVTVK